MFLHQTNAARTTSRSGFTLLEVTLATSIAVLLLGALYVAMDVQMRHAQAGREMVEQATLSRTLLQRIGNDVSSAVALADPARFRSASSNQNGGGAAGAASPAAGAAGATGGTTGAAGTTTTASATPITIPMGVQGDVNQLNIYVSKVPREIYRVSNTDQAPVVSDLRRVSYWLVGGGDDPKGLARQEANLATSEVATDQLPPNVDNETQYIIAPEVRSLSFSYWDGTQWQDTWDCTTLGADGKTPIGSPLAIAVTIELARGDGPDAPKKTYRHVIAISTANGATPQSTSTQGQSSPTTPGGGS